MPIFYNPYDFALLKLINGLHTPFLDKLMLFVTNKYTWIPLYIFLLYLVIKTYKKNTWRIVFAIIVAVGLADRITSGFMKPYFTRLRPCHDPKVAQWITIVGDCGGKYGFASSHAANSFALAMLFHLLFKKTNEAFSWLWLWASVVSFSRVYVGVHYPSDVLVGAIIGILGALLSWEVFVKLIFKDFELFEPNL